jgi:solute carrier family 25 (mitochondrial oxoglutarate transporter), member 11
MTEFATQFGIALIAGCGASCCVHPLDVIRVNLQVDQSGGGIRQYKGMLHCAATIMKRGGPTALYSGLSAGMFRQITYGGPRMAFYPVLVEKALSPGETVATLPLWKKFLCGATAGGVASVLGVPSEVSLVRMSGDQKLDVADPLRRNYTSVFDALQRVAREEGVGQLWEGAAPTIARAVLLNAGQLAVYSQAKGEVDKLGLTGIPNKFVSSLLASLVAVALSCPADVLKSNMQNASAGEYTGVVDCATKLVKSEGITALWKGYTPATIKLAPHTVISFIILDALSQKMLGKDAM